MDVPSVNERTCEFRRNDRTYSAVAEIVSVTLGIAQIEHVSASAPHFAAVVDDVRRPTQSSKMLEIEET